MSESIIKHMTHALRSYQRSSMVAFCKSKIQKKYMDAVMESYDDYIARSDEKDAGLHIYGLYFNGETKKGSKIYKTEFRADLADEEKVRWLKGPNVKKK